MKPTYLYIKQHKITKLKYFGKTTRKNPIKYTGSGKYWITHIKKHGKEHIETLWYKLFTDEKELKEFADNFSKENNIVESQSWANLKIENGLDGGGWPVGYKHKKSSNLINSQKAKERWKQGKYDPEKLRLSRIGFKQPESQKRKVSEKLSSEWLITSPEGKITKIKNLRNFCLENNLDQGNMSRGKHRGWRCEKIEE